MGKHFLLSSSSDKTIVLWDLRPSPPQQHYTFKGHVDPVTSMCLIGIPFPLILPPLPPPLLPPHPSSLASLPFHYISFAHACTGTDLIAAAGHKLSAEPLLREDPPGSVLKMETYRLQNVHPLPPLPLPLPLPLSPSPSSSSPLPPDNIINRTNRTSMLLRCCPIINCWWLAWRMASSSCSTEHW